MFISPAYAQAAEGGGGEAGPGRVEIAACLEYALPVTNLARILHETSPLATEGFVQYTG